MVVYYKKKKKMKRRRNEKTKKKRLNLRSQSYATFKSLFNLKDALIKLGGHLITVVLIFEGQKLRKTMLKVTSRWKKQRDRTHNNSTLKHVSMTIVISYMPQFGRLNLHQQVC